MKTGALGCMIPVMDDEKDDTNPTEFLLEMAKLQGGVACATVADGHVLVFSKKVLHELIMQADNAGKDQVVVFVKRQDPSQAS